MKKLISKAYHLTTKTNDSKVITKTSIELKIEKKSASIMTGNSALSLRDFQRINTEVHTY